MSNNIIVQYSLELEFDRWNWECRIDRKAFNMKNENDNNHFDWIDQKTYERWLVHSIVIHQGVCMCLLLLLLLFYLLLLWVHPAYFHSVVCYIPRLLLLFGISTTWMAFSISNQTKKHTQSFSVHHSLTHLFILPLFICGVCFRYFFYFYFYFSLRPCTFFIHFFNCLFFARSCYPLSTSYLV